jgi:hypothetical protein
VPKIKPGRRYTPTQLRALMDQATADELQMTGYVLQYDTISNTYAVVHWTNASQNFRQDGNRAQRRAVQGTATDFGELAPIVKRTPQQRVDSLMLKWIEDMKRAGTVPGVDDAKVKEIVGEAWKAGRTEITADVVRTVAAHFLTEAEKQHEEKLSHQTTRHEA